MDSLVCVYWEGMKNYCSWSDDSPCMIMPLECPSTNQLTNLLPQLYKLGKGSLFSRNRGVVSGTKWNRGMWDSIESTRVKLQNLRFEHQPFVIHSGKGLMPKAGRLHNHSSYTRTLTLSATTKFRKITPGLYFLRALLEGLTFEVAYIWWEACVTKPIGLAYS